MSGSLLQYHYHPLLSLLGITILLLSFSAYPDTRSLTNSDYWLEQYGKDQQAMNVMWLEQGMQESRNYHEDNAALQALAQGALKKYWQILVRNNQAYDRYTPIVNGHFVSSTTSANYDFTLTGDTIKFRLSYTF